MPTNGNRPKSHKHISWFRLARSCVFRLDVLRPRVRLRCPILPTTERSLSVLRVYYGIQELDRSRTQAKIALHLKNDDPSFYSRRTALECHNLRSFRIFPMS